MMKNNDNIYIAGHRGMVGSAILRALKKQGYTHLITRDHAELDLIDQQAVRRFFQNQPIDCVILAAAKVGGIHANNTYRAQFIYENLMIEANVIHEAYKSGIDRLLLLGSSCIYPKAAPQPMKEAYLLTGPLEPTNEPYAIAKIAGIKLCESYNRQYGTRYRSVMPTNLYGPNDNYDLENSHVLPAMIRKYHLAKLAAERDLKGIEADEKKYGPIPREVKQSIGMVSDGTGFVLQGEPVVKLWGTGKPLREFLHVDDMADASLFVMNQKEDVFASSSEPDRPTFVNIGCGKEIAVRDAAGMVADVVGFKGETIWDQTKEDGMPKKRLDVSKLNNMGWTPKISLSDGIRRTYDSFMGN